MTIQELSNELGIGVDTLRIWERRYGSPTAKRDSRGHRQYSHRQIEELRTVKKLQNLGLRPGKIFSLSIAEREQLLLQRLHPSPPQSHELERLVTETPPEKIAKALEKFLTAQGIHGFIFEVAEPLIYWLDRCWSEGRISIAREHLISDRLEALLRRGLKSGVQADSGARMLCLTLSGERHKLGLLMAANLFHLQGIVPVLLNEELPLSEVPQLALDLQADAVALSFSIHYPRLQAKNDLSRLRQSLDAKIKLLAGGHAMQRSVSLDNLIVCTDLKKIPDICRRYFPVTQPQKGI